ncbi:MAG: M48 family metallopeptidase [Cyanobacteria bacterium P01_F01_bin.42]
MRFHHNREIKQHQVTQHQTMRERFGLFRRVQSSRSSRGQKFVAIAAIGLTIGISSPVQAVSWRDLFLRGVQVIQLSNVSTRQEIALGEQIHRNLQAQGMRLNRSRRLNSYVKDVGSRLAQEAQRTEVPYRFFVVQDNAINAYATAGGFTYVTTGLMNAADNEAQLASVMAHEIAHIEDKHLIKQIRQQTIARGLVSTALGSDRNVLANIGVELLVNRPRSRSDEFEADAIGLEILRDADYSTSEMPRFMRKLLSGSRPPTFLSTHPAVPDRISQLESQISAGYTNACDRGDIPVSCGTNESLYQQDVKRYL